LPECQSFAEVRIVHDCNEFSNALDLAKRDGEDKKFVERVRSLAKRNSWVQRVEVVLEHLRKATRARRSWPEP
jgi:hypothetical protein